jgi:hypothetical protein|eukprot:SAG25_NODE_4388_length_826_cov_1.481431_2_plen_98_part_00
MPSETTEAQAVLGLLRSSQALLARVSRFPQPSPPSSLFSLSYDEVVIGVTVDDSPTTMLESYLVVRPSAERGDDDRDTDQVDAHSSIRVPEMTVSSR